MAALDACNQILKRLEPIRKKLPDDASMRNIAETAFFDRVDLSAHGFFALDDSRCGYDWDVEKPHSFPENSPQNSWKGHPFNYFTQGCACTEVEIDVLTGNHKTLRSDLLVDGKTFKCPCFRHLFYFMFTHKSDSWTQYQSCPGHWANRRGVYSGHGLVYFGGGGLW